MSVDEFATPPPIDWRILQLIRETSQLLRSPPKRAAWQWAEAKRELPAGSAEPGPFRTARAPWVRAITERIRDPRHTMVVAVMGSQMSKTDGVQLSTIGWKLDDDPQPILYIGPTQKNVESISKQRVAAMLHQVPSLWAGLAKGKANTLTEKFINGVRLGFGWAGSATELASHPAALVLLDEYDRMKPVPGEGDPVSLAEARTSTYPNGTIAITSTPLEGAVETITLDTGLTHWAVSEDVASPTWKLWQEGTRHEWAWPCPECREYFIPRSNLLLIPEGATPPRALKQARLTCPHCGALLEDRHKGWMNSRGRFVAPGQRITPAGEVQGPEPESPTFSAWVSGLCSMWRPFGRRAATWVAALRSGDPGRIQAAVNTGFGECYQLRGEAPEWKAVQACAQGYARGQVPDGVWVITAGVDVQGNRLVYTVRGWGAELESWQIESGELWGDTDKPPVWNRLTHLLERDWDGLAIQMMLVDSGYRRDEVYAWCRQHLTNTGPAKGRLTMDKPFHATPVDVTVRGKVKKHGLKLWLWHTDLAKLWVHNRIEWPPEVPGAWHVHQDPDEAYCKQVVAEQRLIGPGRKVVWVAHGDNHFLDAEAMAYMAARILAVDQLTRPPVQRKNPTAVKLPPLPPPREGDWINTSGDWL